MSGGDVKRYIVRTDSYGIHIEEKLDGGWVSASDHDRIVAKQKRVIEMLKESHRKNADEDFRGNRSTESVRSFITLKEVEAIEKEQS